MSNAFKFDPASTHEILEPLCKATEQTFAPLDLYENDYLELELDEEGKRFLVQATALRPFQHGIDDKDDLVVINDTEMVKDIRGPSTNAAERWQKRIPERKGGIGSSMGFGR